MPCTVVGNACLTKRIKLEEGSLRQGPRGGADDDDTENHDNENPPARPGGKKRRTTGPPASQRGFGVQLDINTLDVSCFGNEHPSVTVANPWTSL